MKHSTTPTAALDLLAEAARQYGFPLHASEAQQLADLAQWIATAGARIGLTQYQDVPALVSSLICPTLALLAPALAPAAGERLLDFGAGSGAVGLTVGLLRADLEITLADRRERVIHFVDITAARFGLANCRGHLANLRQPPADPHDAAAMILLRAFGPVSEALEAAAKHLSPNGGIALWHQPPAPAAPIGLERAAFRDTTLSGLQLTIFRCARETAP